MSDTTKIHALIRQARARLRLQAALDAAVTSSIVAIAAALVVIYAVRMQAIPEHTGIGLLLGCLAIIGLGAAIGALRPFPTHMVANRIDRASNLADRLSSACAFEGQVNRTEDPETAALMNAAIRDAVEAVPRADIKKATPFYKPRDSRAALAFFVVSALVAGLYWPEQSMAGPAGAQALPRQGLDDKNSPKPDAFVSEDLEYAREIIRELDRSAKEQQDPTLEEFAKEIEELLAKAERGEISKEELMEQMAQAEQRYSEAANEEQVEQAMADLQETGEELKKSPLTQELGKALEQGDLAKAQEELEKLAEKLEQQELSDKQQQELAKNLEKAADKFEKKDQERDQKLQEEMAKNQEETRRLQRKHDETQDEQEKRRLAQKLDQQKRELKRLEREQEEREKSAQRRTLKSLHRNMKQAAQAMQQDQQQKQQDQQQQDQQQQQQDQQQQQQAASRNLRDVARDTGKVDADRRKVTNQKKMASQLTDLKEAMRRARRQGGQGMQDLFGKNKRNEDFRLRARGQRGSRGAWQPGQQGQQGQQGQNGQGQNGQGQGQNGQGQQPGGDSYGDGHDPYVMGDATPKSGNTKDESLSGQHGRGPSRRETILSAAQKGFASRSYQQIYAEYKEIVEEVMRAEKVPSGYKYYVKRYFQKIKPHSMD